MTKKNYGKRMFDADDFNNFMAKMKEDGVDIVECTASAVTTKKDDDTGKEIIECYLFLPKQYHIIVRLEFISPKKIEDFVVPIITSGALAFNVGFTNNEAELN